MTTPASRTGTPKPHAGESRPTKGKPKQTVRTAVVIVHGMGEQLPLDTLNQFIKTALPKVEGERRYFSRPERVTDSYEARRHLAAKQTKNGKLLYGQTEFFEYHWSYLMTDNKLGDLLPTVRRMLFRKPSTVPFGLRRVWWLVWTLIITLTAIVIIALIRGIVEEFTLAGILAATLPAIVAGILFRLLKSAGNVVTKSFVDVVRYLDRSPRSYEVRRAIRKGMIDLLRAIHDKDRYSRVIIVAHSLGAYIAYDAIAYLWPQMSKLHCGPISKSQPLPLRGLPELEAAAERVLQHPVEEPNEDQMGELLHFRAKQFELWKGLREQGSPWLVTDFISVGTPMYFAHLLYTKTRAEFDQLVRTAELPRCPPRHTDQTVEGPDLAGVRYGWNNQGRIVLTHGAPFAVVRWTNLYFPAEKSWNGDWFGGPLRSLFGKGILDHSIMGNLPGRRTPGLAHARYFVYPNDIEPDDAATVLQGYLQLAIVEELGDLLSAPGYLEESGVTL
jgi:hypothetical protein